MVKFLSNIAFNRMPRVAQDTSYYCGPAVVEMLLRYQGIDLDQYFLVQASEVGRRIKEHGMTLEELARTVNSLDLPVKFWFKRDSSIRELASLVHEYGYPVGVEWQGIFDYDDDEENPYDPGDDPDDDAGHYSIVTYCSTAENLIMIADPDKHYAGVDREFSVLQFERRWWDVNEVIDPVTHRQVEVDDYHALFIVVPQFERFPAQFGMLSA